MRAGWRGQEPGPECTICLDNEAEPDITLPCDHERSLCTPCLSHICQEALPGCPSVDVRFVGASKIVLSHVILSVVDVLSGRLINHLLSHVRTPKSWRCAPIVAHRCKILTLHIVQGATCWCNCRAAPGPMKRRLPLAKLLQLTCLTKHPCCRMPLCQHLKR